MTIVCVLASYPASELRSSDYCHYPITKAHEVIIIRIQRRRQSKSILHITGTLSWTIRGVDVTGEDLNVVVIVYVIVLLFL